MSESVAVHLVGHPYCPPRVVESKPLACFPSYSLDDMCSSWYEQWVAFTMEYGRYRHCYAEVRQAWTVIEQFLLSHSAEGELWWRGITLPYYCTLSTSLSLPRFVISCSDCDCSMDLSSSVKSESL